MGNFQQSPTGFFYLRLVHVINERLTFVFVRMCMQQILHDVCHKYFPIDDLTVIPFFPLYMLYSTGSFATICSSFKGDSNTITIRLLCFSNSYLLATCYGGPVGRALRQLRHALLEVCTAH